MSEKILSLFKLSIQHDHITDFQKNSSKYLTLFVHLRQQIAYHSKIVKNKYIANVPVTVKYGRIKGCKAKN